MVATWILWRNRQRATAAKLDNIGITSKHGLVIRLKSATGESLSGGMKRTEETGKYSNYIEGCNTNEYPKVEFHRGGCAIARSTPTRQSRPSPPSDKHRMGDGACNENVQPLPSSR
jgi:hypothetical protein